MPDEILKEIVSILLLHRQIDSLYDIANHLAHIVVNSPFVKHTALTTSFDDVLRQEYIICAQKL